MSQKLKSNKYKDKVEKRIKALKEQCEQTFDENIKLKKREIPELLTEIDQLYDHLPPD